MCVRARGARARALSLGVLISVPPPPPLHCYCSSSSSSSSSSLIPYTSSRPPSGQARASAPPSGRAVAHGQDYKDAGGGGAGGQEDRKPRPLAPPGLAAGTLGPSIVSLNMNKSSSSYYLSHVNVMLTPSRARSYAVFEYAPNALSLQCRGKRDLI